MLTSEMIMREIEENAGRIKGFGVKRIGLFGSYVRAEQNAGSDVDILVEFEKSEKTFDNYMELKFLLEDLFGCKVDLVTVETIKPDLKSHILEGVEYATQS